MHNQNKESFTFHSIGKFYLFTYDTTTCQLFRIILFNQILAGVLTERKIDIDGKRIFSFSCPFWDFNIPSISLFITGRFALLSSRLSGCFCVCAACIEERKKKQK